MRVIAWNLFHGRSVPPAGRPLAGEFAARLAGWDWDVALLQEVPPWWAAPLARRSGAQQRTALTSRNWGLPVRRAIAARRPDLLRANGGGANVVLARTSIVDHRSLPLRTWPERRVAQLVRLAGGACVVNYHGSASVPLAEAELEQLWRESLAWAGASPLILGGDLNLRDPAAPGGGVAHVAARDVDHLFVRGLAPQGPASVLPRDVEVAGRQLELSDHPPLALTLG